MILGVPNICEHLLLCTQKGEGPALPVHAGWSLVSGQFLWDGGRGISLWTVYIDVSYTVVWAPSSDTLTFLGSS